MDLAGVLMHLAMVTAFVYGLFRRTRGGDIIGRLVWLGIAAVLTVCLAAGFIDEPFHPSFIVTMPLFLWMIRGCYRIAMKPLYSGPPKWEIPPLLVPLLPNVLREPRRKYDGPQYDEPPVVLQQQPDGTWR